MSYIINMTYIFIKLFNYNNFIKNINNNNKLK